MSNKVLKNKQYGAYTKTQIAQFYNLSYKTFRKMLYDSGFAAKYPNLMGKRVMIFFKDKPCFEEFFGPSSWDDYLKLSK